jgi:hypothetical protein
MAIWALAVRTEVMMGSAEPARMMLDCAAAIRMGAQLWH